MAKMIMATALACLISELIAVLAALEFDRRQRNQILAAGKLPELPKNGVVKATPYLSLVKS